MSELDIALAKIQQIEAQNAVLLKVLRARESVGHITVDTERGYQFVGGDLIDDLMDGRHPVYLLNTDELDAAGILITPEVKL
jgi:hypothetical protein